MYSAISEIQSTEQHALIHRIQGLFLEKLAIRVDSIETDLLETGVLDSAMLVELILLLEEKFGVRLAMTELGVDGFRSLAQIAQTVADRKAAQKPPSKGGQNGNSVVAAAPPVGAVPDEIDFVREIQSVFAEQLSLRVGSLDADLFKTGVLDSMSLVQLIVELEKHFNVELPMEEVELESFRSLNTIATYIAAHKLAQAGSRF